LRVMRLLAAVFRFFAISWSSLDGVGNLRQCPSTSRQHALSLKTSPGGLCVPAGALGRTESLAQNISRFGHWTGERNTADLRRKVPLSALRPCGLIGGRDHVAAVIDNGRRSRHRPRVCPCLYGERRKSLRL